MAALTLLVSVALASIPTFFSNQGLPSAAAGRAQPHAGRLFVGAYAGFPQPQYIHVLSVGCRVRLWNRAHSQVRQLKPVVRYYRTKGGRVRRITCGWRIPPTAAGEELELPKPNCLDCPFDREPFIVVYDDARNPPGFGHSGLLIEGAHWRVRP